MGTGPPVVRRGCRASVLERRDGAEGKTTVRLSTIERWAEPLFITRTGPTSVRTPSCWRGPAAQGVGRSRASGGWWWR